MRPAKARRASRAFASLSSVVRHFPNFSYFSVQLHSVWLGGAPVLGSRRREPSASALTYALRGRSLLSSSFIMDIMFLVSKSEEKIGRK